MEITWTRPAMNNLHRICDFRKEQKDAAAARKLRKDIFDKIDYLKKFPSMGKKEKSILRKEGEYRSIIQQNFKIIYRIQDDEIFIVRVFDTRQNPDKLIF